MTPSWACLMLIMTILGMKVGFINMSHVCKTQFCTQNVTDHSVINLGKGKKNQQNQFPLPTVAGKTIKVLMEEAGMTARGRERLVTFKHSLMAC